MFSEEFMRYLINYQKAEPKKEKSVASMSIPFSNDGNKKLATILLAIKK